MGLYHPGWSRPWDVDQLDAGSAVLHGTAVHQSLRGPASPSQ